MYTFQDLSDVQNDEQEKINLILEIVSQYRNSKYREKARTELRYFNGENVTICEFQKFITEITGDRIPDLWSANFKIPSNFFYRFVTQKVNFLLGNGVNWSNESTKNKLGNKKYSFDNQLQELAKLASINGVSFGFFNLDHLEIFDNQEFIPLYDEENGALKAGIRFWQIDKLKPLRITLYEIDGLTEYIQKKNKIEILQGKRPYKKKIRVSEISGTEIYAGENYPTFPIVPFYGNKKKQSDLTGIREQIDAFDLIKSGFANTIDEASYIYWTLQNAGGMDDIDLVEFIDRLKKLHTVVTDDNVTAVPNTLQAPFEAREILLKRLEQDLYRDALALDVSNISNGAVTATQIRAAYEPLNIKTDDFEYCVLQFINSILEIANIDDTATFTRSILINVNEDIQTILQAAAYLPQDYVTEKILNILGDGDKAERLIQEMNINDLNRLSNNYLKEETGLNLNG